VSTTGSLRRSMPAKEYGVSELAVCTAVSSCVKTRARLRISFQGALAVGSRSSSTGSEGVSVVLIRVIGHDNIRCATGLLQTSDIEELT